MPDVVEPKGSLVEDAEKLERTSGVVEWLDGLLDGARDRADMPLARLIAAVMDDLGAASAKE